jgi:hypothetical protein
MKPLNKRTPVPTDVAKHLQKTSEEKLIPEDQWQSIKKAAKEQQESK